MSVEERDDHIDAFNNDHPLPDTPSGNSPDILIGTLQVLGVGYTCTRAFRLILLGPSWMEMEEAQGKARIRRIGQNNPITYTYRLICTDVQVENSILDRQAMRKAFQEMAMSVQKEAGIMDVMEID